MRFRGVLVFYSDLFFAFKSKKGGYEGGLVPPLRAEHAHFFNSSSRRRRGTEAFKRCRSGGVFRIDKTQSEKPTYPQK